MPPVDLAANTQDVLSRMLRRLPASLWNTSPDDSTLQRDLFGAFASQVAVWLEQLSISRTMTLLREAQGVDLDTLLADYGLKRYLGRPDAYARQIGINILWTPKGTEYSVARLADLLFDQPHTVLRTGRQHLHVFLASTHAVTTPYSYWSVISQEGLWHALTIDASVPTLSTQPPPGVNVAPGPHTLSWLTALDQFGATWYLTIAGDTLVPTTTQPSGYGSTEPFSVLDGWGQRWNLQVDALSQATIAVLDTGLPGYGYWRFLDPLGATLYLWIEGNVPTVGTSPPAGSTDQTPGGSPLAWFTALDPGGSTWYVHLEAGTLVPTSISPGGIGTTTPLVLLDGAGNRWTVTMDAGTEATVATEELPYNADEVVISPDTAYTAVQLFDVNGTAWWLSMVSGTTQLSSLLPSGAQDVTAAGGPYHWLRVYDVAGGLYYLYPEPSGDLTVSTITPGGAGTAHPQTLGDASGVAWHLGVDLTGSFGVSDTPAVDYGNNATAFCMTDPTGSRWFWRVDGQVLEWSTVLWPSTIDQSPWGELGWLKVTNEIGETRYISPDPQGDPMASSVPPPGSPWGWTAPVRWRDRAGVWWHLDVLVDNRIGVTSEPPEDIPPAQTPLVLAEALDAFRHVQAAGSLVTLLVS